MKSSDINLVLFFKQKREHFVRIMKIKAFGLVYTFECIAES